jgi:hypothetical protein
MTFSLNILSIGNEWGQIQSHVQTPIKTLKSRWKSIPKSSSTQLNVIQSKNTFMSPLGIACCDVVNTNDWRRIRSFLEPTLKIDVMGSNYGASPLCDFPCVIWLRKFVNLTITTNHKETLNILLIKGVIKSA